MKIIQYEMFHRVVGQNIHHTYVICNQFDQTNTYFLNKNNSISHLHQQQGELQKVHHLLADEVQIW